MANPEILTTDNFKVLACLYDNKDKNNVVKITQGEVSEIVGISRVTINFIFKALREANYLVMDKEHVGRYVLTDDAVKAVELLRKMK